MLAQPSRPALPAGHIWGRDGWPVSPEFAPFYHAGEAERAWRAALAGRFAADGRPDIDSPAPLLLTASPAAKAAALALADLERQAERAEAGGYSLEVREESDVAAPEGDGPAAFAIPLRRWDDFRAKFAKLARKAARLGCPAPGYEVTGEGFESFTVEYRDGEGRRAWREVRVPVRHVILTGEAPALAGWQFVARVERLADNSALIHRVPGAEGEIPARYRHGNPSDCEHCRKARVRADTFIVREVATGRTLQVGRQCLADFTGINTPEKAAGQAAFLSSLRDSLAGEGGESWIRGVMSASVDIPGVLEVASAYIRGEGWVSRKAAESGNGPEATASLVARHFSAFGGDVARAEGRLKKTAGGVNDSDRERAAKVAAWVRDEMKGGTEYADNLIQLFRGDLAERRHIGLVASAVAAYQRAMNQAAELAAARARPSAYVGEVGQRLRDVPATAEFCKALEPGQFGPRTLLKFRAVESGAVLTWFASGDHELTRGALYLVTGTVKKHESYKDVKQTMISRATYRRAD